ncbi:MAG: hypothetical protein ABSC04_16150 [Syntrophobacteraceae bacterium]|jgi:hypothetical protein
MIPNEFENFLTLLKTPVAEPIAFSLLQPPSSLLSLKTMFDRPKDEVFESYVPTAIKIMESGIFYEGGLKGWIGEKEPFPIRDIRVFVLGLAVVLAILDMRLDESKRREFIRTKLDSASQSIQLLKDLVGWQYGKQISRQLTSLQRKFLDLQNAVLAQAPMNPKRMKSKIKQWVAKIFASHIDAPHIILAERASELLTAFGIQAGSDSIRKKLTKRRTIQAVHS